MKELFAFLLKNETLAMTYPLGIIIVMAYNYRAMYYGSVNMLFYYEKTKILWKITFIAGVVNVALNFTLIPVFGYQVAVITTFASLMFMGYSGYFLKSFKEHAKLNYYPWFWMLATVGLTVLVYFLRDLSILHKCMVSVASLGAMGGLMYWLRKWASARRKRQQK